MASEEELANLQRLSNDYVFDLEGPLVGQRQSSEALMAEYAQADPIYVHKTAVLPQKYSHYRTVKGDGNCGWRALAFGYFEALLQHGDYSKIATEIARLKSLSNLISVVGYEEYLFEDFVNDTITLLEQTAASIPCQDDGAALLASFNNETITGSIIAHFRLITGAWMKTNPHLYQGFLMGETIQQYCERHIDPFRVEMEHVGLNALIDAVIKPAGISVEILYLDRSEGDEVNTITFPIKDSSSRNGFHATPTIRLLYRPGHYDLIYKIEDVVEVHYMSDPTRTSFRNLAYSHGGLDLGSYFLPGLSTAGISTIPFVNDPHDRNGRISSMDHPLSPDPYPVPVHTAIHPQPPDSTFRPSKFQIEARFRQLAITHPEPCQTVAMKQAGECVSHYKNDRFQPQLWEPGSEYRSTESQSRRSS